MSDETTIVTKAEVTKTETGSPLSDTSTFAGISLRGWLASAIVLTICIMSALGMKVEEPLYTLGGMVVGMYFGQNQKQNK